MEFKNRVFISHSSKDKEFAWKLVRSLNSYQLPVWFDAKELRAGDNLRNNIAEGIKSSDYFVILLSKYSIKSNWVKFELEEAIRQRKLGTFGPKIIPALIEKCKIPVDIKDFLHVDFTQGWFDGLSELLRGISRDHQVVKLVINKKHPLELETKDFSIWIEDFLLNEAPLLFVLDDNGLMGELSNMHQEACDAGNILVDLRYANFLLSNYCTILPFYIVAVRGMVSSKNYFVNKAIESIQTLFKLVIYDFYTSGVQQAFNDGVYGNINTLKSIDGWHLLDDIEKILEGSRIYKEVGRKTEAALLGINDPIDIDLLGKKGIRNMVHLLISSRRLPNDFEKNWQFCDFHPSYDIPTDTWIGVCIPQIAAEHIIVVSHDGESIREQLITLGLKPDDYEKMGLA